MDQGSSQTYITPMCPWHPQQSVPLVCHPPRCAYHLLSLWDAPGLPDPKGLRSTLHFPLPLPPGPTAAALCPHSVRLDTSCHPQIPSNTNPELQNSFVHPTLAAQLKAQHHQGDLQLPPPHSPCPGSRPPSGKQGLSLHTHRPMWAQLRPSPASPLSTTQGLGPRPRKALHQPAAPASPAPQQPPSANPVTVVNTKTQSPPPHPPCIRPLGYPGTLLTPNH